VVIAAVPALLLVPAVLMLPEPQRGASESHTASLGRGSVWTILRIPTLWWIIASGALLNFSMYALATFLPAFLSRVHGFSVASSGIATGVVYLVGGVPGGLLAGQLGDSIIRRRKDGRLLAAAAIALLAVPLACLGILQRPGSILPAIIFLTLTYSALTTYYGLVYSAIQDLVAPNLRGTAMAVYFLAMYMCGASFGPLLTGRLSDFLARRAATLAGSSILTESFRAIGLQQAMLVIPALSIVLSAVLYMSSRTILADIQHRERLDEAVAEVYAER
jgi:sugar phosphate permease